MLSPAIPSTAVSSSSAGAGPMGSPNSTITMPVVTTRSTISCTNAAAALPRYTDALVHRREQQALQRVVRRFVLIGPVAQLHGGEQRGEPQQRRCRLGEEQPVRSQGEAEREQHRGRKRKDRAHSGSAAHLGPQILGDDRLGDPQAHDGATRGRSDHVAAIHRYLTVEEVRGRRLMAGDDDGPPAGMRGAQQLIDHEHGHRRPRTAYGSSSSMSAGTRITHRARVSRWRMPCEKLAHPHRGHLIEPDPFERGLGQARVDVVQAAGEAQVLDGGEVPVQAGLMAQQIGPRPDGASLCPQVEAEHAPLAEGR